MLKKIATSLSVLFLCSCASIYERKYTATEEDFNNYFSNQEIIVATHEVEHEVYEQVPQDNEQYQKDLHQCIEQAFSGKSFQFGSRVITDPEVLIQLHLDAIKISLGKLFEATGRSKTRKYYNAYGVPIPLEKNLRIFDDKEVVKISDEIGDLNSAKYNCIKEHGWSNVKSAKKKSES